VKRNADEAKEAIRIIPELEQTIIDLEKETRTEQTKVKALSEELSRPINVHRWRRLESSDPKRYEMILNLQQLQKQLIDKTDDVIEKDLMIQEQEKIYIELKNILARQPGDEVEDQLDLYRSTHQEKSSQLKAMEEELDMYREQVDQFRRDIRELEERQRGVREEWFKDMGRQTRGEGGIY